MGLYSLPLRDEQDIAPTGYCKRCGGELYGKVVDFCPKCEEELHSDETLIKYFQAWPDRLFAFFESEKDEEYMQPIFKAMREYCEGRDKNGPDLDTWVRS